MKAAAAVAEILKREGVEFLIGYPVNPIIEAAAQADIRTIIVRQERTGLHMADAVSRITSGEQIGVFAMQHGPGHRERLRRRGPGLRRLRADRGAARRLPAPHHQHPAQLQRVPQLPARHQVVRAGDHWPTRCPDAMRRAFTQVRNGRPRPVLVEIPVDVYARKRCPSRSNYTPTPRTRVAPDPDAVDRGRAHAGGGRAAGDLRRPGRALRAARGSSCASWPSCWRRRSRPASRARARSRRTHPLSLGSGGRSIPQAVHQFLDNADVIFGIGCSFSTTNYGVHDAEGQDASSTPRSTRPTSTRTSWPSTR